MRRLVMIIGLLLVAVLLVAISCAPSSREGGVTTGIAPTTPTTPTPAPSPAPSEIRLDQSNMSQSEAPSLKATGDLVTGDAERMIVRTGNIALVVEDVPATIDQITKMAGGFEGYVVSSNVWKQGKKLVGSISIRIAAKHFDNAMRALRGLAVDVTSESSTSKDVTEEYVDLSAKLQNLEATEAQLLKIMEKAEKVEDILAIQRELTNVRGEIERTKARMQYLERTSSTSLIQVGLEQSGLVVKFTASTTRVKVGERVQFYGEIVGGFAPYGYEWDFGDGSTSTDEVPTHAYKSDGSYTVSLTVTDDRHNTDTEIRSGYIFVLPGWSAGSIASAAWNGLVVFGRVLTNILIWIGVFIPVWVVIVGIAYWVLRRRKKKTQ